MKLTRKITENHFNQRINIFQRETPCFDSIWHYHPEYELIYIEKGEGIRYVGDSVAPFVPGELVLVGAYLPHLWKNDNQHTDSKKEVKKIILQFSSNILSQETFKQTEFLKINQLLNDAKLGIAFGNSVTKEVYLKLVDMFELSSTDKLLKLLNLLHELSLTEDRNELSSIDLRRFTNDKLDRLESVIRYISNNYSEEIKLKDVATIANMTTNSFCRFFKKQTNKSFSQFLNEVRVKNAIRLLTQDDVYVSQVGYEVGYNSITNFYKQFKKITGTTPKDYQSFNQSI